MILAFSNNIKFYKILLGFPTQEDFTCAQLRAIARATVNLIARNSVHFSYVCVLIFDNIRPYDTQFIIAQLSSTTKKNQFNLW